MYSITSKENIMKKIAFTLFTFFVTVNLFGQWNSDGSNIHYSSGFVGIGTIPSSPLDIKQEKIHVLLNLTNPSPKLGTVIGLNCDTSNNYQWRLVGQHHFEDNSAGFSIAFWKNKKFTSRPFNIDTLGNVGIGVDKPLEKLEVNGNILIKNNNALILTSPNGSKFEVTVDNYGNLTTNKVNVSTNIYKKSKVYANVEIFPNPTNNSIYINIEGLTSSDVNVEIYDITGKLVFFQIFESSKFNCNINNLTNGTYVLKVTDSNKNIIKTCEIIKN